MIAGAGGAAHLPGMVAAATPLPVIGVPVPLERLDGLDSLLSIVQMPAGVPVATVAVGGARNAGLLAVRMLAVADPGCWIGCGPSRPSSNGRCWPRTRRCAIGLQGRPRRGNRSWLIPGPRRRWRTRRGRARARG